MGELGFLPDAPWLAAMSLTGSLLAFQANLPVNSAMASSQLLAANKACRSQRLRASQIALALALL